MSLVELMISATIGLLLMVVISNLFLSTRQAHRTQDNMARLHENARFAVELLKKNIREAGYWDINFATPAAYGPSPPRTFTPPPAITGVNNDAATGHCTTCDSITIQWYSATDCLNNATPASGLATNHFYINTNRQLMCLGNGNATAGVLLDNVENMQILYGQLTGANRTFLAAGASGLNMGNVDVVQVCILLRTDNMGLLMQTQQYTDCSGTSTTGNTYIRRAYNFTVYLRNRVL